MVENPANTTSSELVSAQAVDAELKTRALELARKGSDNPESLTAHEVTQLCAALLAFLGEGGA